MLIDLAQGRPDFSATVFDVCIIGGGVAGITLAIKLGQAGRRVLVVEAGDRDVNADLQAFYRGEGSDLENLPLDRDAHQSARRLLASLGRVVSGARPLRFRAIGFVGGWCLADRQTGS